MTTGASQLDDEYDQELDALIDSPSPTKRPERLAHKMNKAATLKRKLMVGHRVPTVLDQPKYSEQQLPKMREIGLCNDASV